MRSSAGAIAFLTMVASASGLGQERALACDGKYCAEFKVAELQKQITVGSKERKRKLWYRVKPGPTASESEQADVYLVCRRAFPITPGECTDEYRLHKQFHPRLPRTGAFNLADFRKEGRRKMVVTIGSAPATHERQLDQEVPLEHEDLREILIIYERSEALQ